MKLKMRKIFGYKIALKHEHIPNKDTEGINQTEWEYIFNITGMN